MDREQVKAVVAQTKQSYAVKCRQLDCAVSAEHSVAFTHWRSGERGRGKRMCQGGGWIVCVGACRGGQRRCKRESQGWTLLEHNGTRPVP